MRFAGAVLLVALLQSVPPPPPVRVFDPGFESTLQQVLQPRPPGPIEPATVDGIVVESGSGRPLPGSTVLLQVRTGAAMVTSTRADGTFFFRNVPAGSYSIQADRGGYIPEIAGTTPYPFGAAQQLAPGEKLSGVRLALTRGAVISGRLIDDRGDAVVGALVHALKTTYKDGLPQRESVRSAVSNDLGEYRLFMLRPGEYHIDIIPPTLTSSLIPNKPTVIPLYFPDTIDAKAAQAILLHEGESVDGVNFSAVPTRTRQITGSVQGNGGEPVGVVLSPLNGTTTLTRTLNPNDGTFQFLDVAPGSYILVARTPELHSAISFDVRNADMLNLRLSVGKGFRIPTHVHIDGHPAGEDPDLEKVYILARPEIAVPGIEAETYSPFADGRFTLDLPAGDYRLDMTKPEGAYVKSMILGGVDVLNRGLHVTGSTDMTLEIVVASDSGSIAGRSEKRDVTVVLVPDAARRGQRTLFKFMNGGAAGEFHFEKVPPGDYKLFAWAEENGGPWLDPEYLRGFEERGTPVHVNPDKTTTLDRAIPVL